MTDAAFGKRDARGEWRPPYLVQSPPLVCPPRPLAALKWLFQFNGYLWPLNSLVLAITLVTWFVLTPDLASMRSFAPWWIAIVFGRNLALAFLMYGGLHLYLYVFKRQGTDFKYNVRPQATKNPAFLFGHQVRDNMFWTLVSGVTVWSAYEAVTLWAYANGVLPFIDWGGNSVWFVVWFVALLLLVPAIHTVHFYFFHRLLHWRPLYDSVHTLHHRNVNVGPWSGLSMHPVEHLLYLSGVFFLWAIALHPIHALFLLQFAALVPAQGHSGFDRIVIKGESAVRIGSYFHYLHHRYFECNYGSELVPLDKWFGTFHDGSDVAHARMTEQMRQRRGAVAQA